MDKQKIVVSSRKSDIIDFGNQTDIVIKPYLSLEDKLKLIDEYLFPIFDFKNNIHEYAVNEIKAEYSIIIGVIDLCTNLSVDLKNDLNDLDVLISSGLWDEVKKHIINYEEFRKELRDILVHIKEDIAIEKSLGVSFDKVTTAVVKLVEKFANTDVSNEGIEKALEKFKDETLKLQKEIPTEIPQQKTRKKRVNKKDLIQ